MQKNFDTIRLIEWFHKYFFYICKLKYSMAEKQMSLSKLNYCLNAIYLLDKFSRTKKSWRFWFCSQYNHYHHRTTILYLSASGFFQLFTFENDSTIFSFAAKLPDILEIYQSLQNGSLVCLSLIRSSTISLP